MFDLSSVRHGGVNKRIPLQNDDNNNADLLPPSTARN
jgi:hypothetical protein